MKKIFTLLTILCAATTALATTGAESDRTNENHDNGLLARILNLENKSSAIPRVWGFVQLRYQWNNQDVSTFDIRRATLGADGTFARKFEYRLLVEFAPSPMIYDAYIKYNWKPWLGIQFGQFKVPFSMENAYSPLALETIENAQAIVALAGIDDVSGVIGTGRDMGISIYGGVLPRKGYDIINYTLGVYNGCGINRSDDNKRKDFAGRLDINPMKALTLSGSCYLGKTNSGTGGDERLAAKERWSLGARYDDGTVLVRGEWLHGKTGMQKTEGWYAIAGYKVTGTLQPLLRYDYLKRDLSDPGSGKTCWTMGLDWWPYDFLKLQLNYTLGDYSSQLDTSHTVAVMASVKF